MQPKHETAVLAELDHQAIMHVGQMHSLSSIMFQSARMRQCTRFTPDMC